MFAHPRLSGHPRYVTQRGFTAVELMVAVAIVAVLAALAAPSFTLLMERWRVRSASEDLTSALYYARSEAIKRGGGVAIDATSGWNQGWKVTYTQGGTTTDLQVSAITPKVTITQSGGVNKLFVDRWGLISETSGGVPSAIDILLHPIGKSTTDNSAIRLCMSTGGRIAHFTKGAACS